MRRGLLATSLMLLLAGCQVPPEQVPLKPLPENGPPESFADLVKRARVQAAAANEAFYVNKWSDLDDAARGLDQTARYLVKATAVPNRHRDNLPIEAGDLGKEAAKLREAAMAQDEKKATEALQRIQLMVRQLRAED
jgi:hypothetical protein